MCGVERKFPEKLPWQAALWIVFLSLFFSHVFPSLSAFLIYFFKLPVKPLLGLVLEGHLPVVLALLLISITLYAANAKWVVHFLTGRDLGVILLCWIISIFGVGYISNAWKYLLHHYHMNFVETQATIKIAQNCSSTVFWVLFLLTAIIVPVFEEICYRRALFSLISPLGKWPACILTAGIFSAIHFYIAVFPGLWFFAIILQLSFFKTKNLAVPIMIHALFNATSMLASHYCC